MKPRRAQGQYVPSAALAHEQFTCCGAPILGALNAENHLVFGHSIGRDRAREFIVRASRQPVRTLLEKVSV